MLHECSDCPGEAHIDQYFNTNNFLQSKKEVIYSCWESIKSNNKSSDDLSSMFKVKLLTKIESATSFLKNLSSEICNLTKHHYISEDQKNSFLAMKENLNEETGLMLMDFSENYAFIAQDSTQGFYFNNDQATVHPVVLYTKGSSDTINVTSFCIISDYNKHKAYVVNVFLEKVLTKVKEKFPNIMNINYFSDGAPTQYKNK